MDGAIEFLLKAIAEQLSLTTNHKNSLLQNLENYLPEIYQYSITIMDIVIKPIAYSLLGFLLLIEFQQIAHHLYGKQSEFGGLDLFLPLFIKVGLTLLVLRNLMIFLNTIMEIGITISQGISRIEIRESPRPTLNVGTIMEEIYDFGFFEKLTLLLILLIPLIFSIIVGVLAKVIIFLRFLEMYVYLSISPLPIVALLNTEVGHFGKNFLRMFGAASLQGVLLFIVLSIYPLLIGTAFSMEENHGMMAIIGAIVGNCLSLSLCLVYTMKWSKTILVYV
ncbi:hypothetical protein A5844_001956 [Enterococcus sp. 10A9_DIV0425]|uniref:TrbL/VirB6 plasmid conjugal transfer protein n=1 Tax=Candidatus Enterococcus wittei TaxID=1987383 RepID=A0A242JY62_9ENTE|nr:hypothetical protein [Enterococcus sp. 10A9_DIV0425]OTP10257.1 hypothetical protein A5844_001956 [Enterococcus sp. 10A9_DIV0425]THE10226.1 hypothetical protein E1H99_09855 [Enterococcus hirae]